MTNPPRERPQMPDVAEIHDESVETADALQYDPETDTYRASFEERSESVPWAVVTMVAAISGTGPTELPSLGSVVDSEALDRVVNSHPSDHSRGDVRVTFRYDGHEVTVHGDGIVAVRPDEGNLADD